jgi:hypothetical protein
MVRAIFSAILGYVLMVVISLVGIAATWFGLGNRFAFIGDTNQASMGWSWIQLGIAFIAAIIAGAVATRVAGPSARLGIAILMAMLIGLGALSLFFALNAAPTPLPEGKTIDTLTFTEAGQYARSPTWYHLAVVVIGSIGLLLGFAQQLPAALAASKESELKG